MLNENNELHNRNLHISGLWKKKILHGEVLDKDGNFYNENYRSAKAELNYICTEGYQVWHPVLTFFGFRYLKLEEYPQKPEPGHFKC